MQIGSLADMLEAVHHVTCHHGGMTDDTLDLSILFTTEDADTQTESSTPLVRSRNGTTILREGVLDILSSPMNADNNNNGGLLERWGPSFLLLTHVTIQANENVLKTASKVDRGDKKVFAYSPATVVVVASGVSVVLANLVSFMHHGTAGVRNCWDVQMLRRMAPGSILFTTGQILKFVALTYLPTDLVALLDQGQLVLLAIFSKFFLSRRYTPPQWLLLALVSVQMVLYMRLRTDDNDPGGYEVSTADCMVGCIIMLCCTVTSVSGSILNEFLLKGGGDRPRPYWELKAIMDTNALVLSAAWSFAASGHSARSIFAGWDQFTVLVCFVMVVKLWVSGLICKVLDSVVKQLGSSVGVIMIYLEALCLPGFNTVFDFNTSLALISTLGTVITFALSAGRENKQKVKLEGHETRMRRVVELINTPSSRRLPQVGA